MNREILFRGFNEDPNGNEEIELDGRIIKGKWLYGYYSDEKGIGTDFPSIEVFKNSEPNPISWKVIPETVSQYAGLDDKNGRKIFENSLVDFFYDLYHDNVLETKIATGIIKFLNGSFCIVPYTVNPETEEDEWECFINLSDYAPNVILRGTIFDKR